MLVLGLQGSPRKKGNTNYLISAFMDAAEKVGRPNADDRRHQKGSHTL